MKVERIFDEQSNIKIEEILDALLTELVDTYIEEQYNSINHTTSSNKGDVI